MFEMVGNSCCRARQGESMEKRNNKTSCFAYAVESVPKTVLREPSVSTTIPTTPGTTAAVCFPSPFLPRRVVLPFMLHTPKRRPLNPLGTSWSAPRSWVERLSGSLDNCAVLSLGSVTTVGAFGAGDLWSLLLPLDRVRQLLFSSSGACGRSISSQSTTNL